MTKPAPTTYDLIVFGATSFVGQILTQYLFDSYGIAGEVKWAIAGRSESKLSTLKSSLGEGAGELPVILADATDDQALKAMCEQTRVVISTVGPYALYGEPRSEERRVGKECRARGWLWVEKEKEGGRSNMRSDR